MNYSGSWLQAEGEASWLTGRRGRICPPVLETEALVEAALESSPVGLIVLAEDGSVRLVTRAASQLLGCRRSRGSPGLSVRKLLRSCSHLDSEAVRLLAAAIEDAEAEAQEILLAVSGPRGRRTIAVDVRSIGSAGCVLSFSDVTETRESQDWFLDHLSCDPVTGLKNRQHLMLMLRGSLAGCEPKAGESSPSVLLLGLHQFRRCVEIFGLGVGDTVLRLVGERLSALLGPDDMLGYFGDGEFAFVVGAMRPQAEIASFCADIAASVCAPLVIDGQAVPMDARLGVALAPADGRTPEDLVAHASMALHTARSGAPRQVCFFDNSLTERALARRTLESDLQQALPRGEFELFYQPQVDVHSNRVSGFEALIRWRSPTRGLVPPIAFIPLAEQTGQIVEIGDWVLCEACNTAALWPEEVTVAVNASPLQFESGNFARLVAKALEVSQLPAHRLEIEITETLLLRETGAVLGTIAALRELGVRLVLDDFGTGYASLSQLSRFSFDKIKIDRSFVSIGDPTPENSAIIRAIAALGHSLGIPTTAEGVETELQLQQITAHGCTSVQGYFFSRPVPACEVPALLERLR